ncbi:MAG: hypothetical protein C4334_09445 [Pyrinomonas sp.]|uniref:hypothetical protein n=1 Tax=Pyrinomonas sp. TaxID=2080306 RepID=UPI003330EBEC
MKIRRPGSPLSGGAEPLEPLDPKDLERAVKSERFASTLSNIEAQLNAQQTSGAQNPVRAMLEQIARNADLLSGEGAAQAVRASARFMIRSRLRRRFRNSAQGRELVEALSEFVATDPLLSSKILSILQKLRAA